MKTNADNDSGQDKTTTYLSKMTSVGNLLIALSALSYAMGFIVVNTYLATKYKIYNFEILNARYIFSGASFLLLCLLAFFGASFLSGMMDKIHNRPVYQRILGFIFMFGVAHGLYTAIFISILVVALNREPSSFFSLPSEIPIALWFDLAIVVCYVLIRSHKNKIWEKLPHNLPFPSSIFTSIIILALIYGTGFYFYLPPSVGGGLPTPITLVFDESKIDIAQHIIPITSENPSIAVYLIEQNGDSYYVLVGDKYNSISDSLLLPVQVDKTLIVGVIYPNKITTSKFLDVNNITFPSTLTPTMMPTEASTP